MGQVTKRCHWVPQGYLKAFSADGGTRVWRFAKSGGDPELKRIDKVAVKFNLYVPKDQSGQRDDRFEKKLADLEQWFGHPLWRELQDGMVDLSWEPLRKMVGLLVAVMFLRSPAQFEQWKSMHRQMVDLFSGAHGLPSAYEHEGKVYPLDPSSWPEYCDASEDDLKRSWIEVMDGAASYAELFLDMRWSVVFADEPVFITSDNPVTFIHPSLTFRGLKNANTTLVFPLSPTRILMMDNRLGEPANQYYPLKSPAAVQNGLIWRGALDYMFSHRHTDVVCAEMLADAEEGGFV